MGNATNKNSSKQKNFSNVREWIVNIGTILAYLALLVMLIIVGINHPANINPTGENIWTLIWDSIFSVVSGIIAIADVIVATLLIKLKHNCSKLIVIIFAVGTYIIAIFNNVAIKYPCPQAMIVIVNFLALTSCITYILFNNTSRLKHTFSLGTKDNSPAITRAISGTENKKIIAVQMYSVKTKSKQINDTEFICFNVRSGENFIREGYDINGVSAITYELEREIVDKLQINLLSYHQFIEYGNENTKKSLINSIDEEIQKLQLRLKSIEIEKRDITKEDCCIARVLVIYLSFKRILDPDPESQESHADYIGEVSLHDGDLNLDPSTENKLFTLVRTGVLGAALLGENSRHVFHYRKDGMKQGRKYCASVLNCVNVESDADYVNQRMDVCLFTVEENKYSAIPVYVFNSIIKREEQIQKALNKIKQGDDVND